MTDLIKWREIVMWIIIAEKLLSQLFGIFLNAA